MISKPITRHIHTGNADQSKEDHVALLRTVTDVCLGVFSNWEYDFLKSGLVPTVFPPSSDVKKIIFFRPERPGIVITRIEVAHASSPDGFGGGTPYTYGVDLSLSFYILDSDSIERICQEIQERIAKKN